MVGAHTALSRGLADRRWDAFHHDLQARIRCLRGSEIQSLDCNRLALNLLVEYTG